MSNLLFRRLHPLNPFVQLQLFQSKFLERGRITCTVETVNILVGLVAYNDVGAFENVDNVIDSTLDSAKCFTGVIDVYAESIRALNE